MFVNVFLNYGCFPIVDVGTHHCQKNSQHTSIV